MPHPRYLWLILTFIVVWIVGSFVVTQLGVFR